LAIGSLAMAIRYFIAVRIGPDWRRVAVASPQYFAKRPAPKHPRDLIG
jgi:hypothetical protein